MTNPTHGGPRKGSGRKPQGAQAKVKTSIAIDATLLRALRITAAQRGFSLNHVIETALMDAPSQEAWSEAVQTPD